MNQYKIATHSSFISCFNSASLMMAVTFSKSIIPKTDAVIKVKNLHQISIIA
jgi:hypothetical protein